MNNDIRSEVSKYNLPYNKLTIKSGVKIVDDRIVIKNKKLKNKKTLYIRIRAYKRINRKNKYSTWSEIKKVIVN